MVSIYNEIIKKAWQIFWRNKFLWFFGLFLVLISLEAETIIRNYTLYTEGSLSLGGWQELFKSGFGGIFSDFWGGISSTTVGAVVTLLLFIIVAVALIWLIVISIGAIIYNTLQAEAGKKIGFNSGFSVGLKYFWKNLSINLLAKIADYAFLILTGLFVSLSFFESVHRPILMIFIILSFCVSLIISFVAKYASCYVVARGQTFGQSIHSGWRLFIKNWLASLEMAITIFLIDIVANLILLLVLVLIAVPFILFIFILIQGGYNGLANIFLGILMVIAIIILMLFAGTLSTFIYSAWTIFFQKLDQGKKTSKLLKWADALAGQKPQSNIK